MIRRTGSDAYARIRVYAAIKRGDMVRPLVCSLCGNDEDKIEGHHEDYSKPLEVEWLCQPCHYQRHRDIRAGAR